MKNTILFSIIITTFNNDNLLTRCLDSMNDIDLKNVEIIVVDDGSIINQEHFIPDFFLKNKNFKLIRQKNLGPGAARNCGINNGLGKYLIFVDADDYFIDCMFLKFYEEIKEKKIESDLIRIGFVKKQNYKKKEYLIKKSLFFYSLSEYISKIFIFSRLGVFASWAHVYNRKYLISNNLYFKKETYVEDLEHLLRSYPLIKTIYISNICYYMYDTNNNKSITNTKREEVGKSIQEFLKPEKILNPQLKAFFTIWYYLSYKPKYKKSIKGFAKNIWKTPFTIWK